MSQFGTTQIPLLVEDDNAKQGQYDIPTPINVVKFKANRMICFVIYVLIIIAIVSRSITTYNTDRNDKLMCWYQALTFLALILLPRCVPEKKDEILPWYIFAKPTAIALCVFEVVFGSTALFLTAPRTLFPAIMANMTTSVLLTYLGSHFRISDYKPFKDNKKYQKIRTIYRNSEHGISIKESRPFLIVLENTGSQAIALAGLSIKRCTLVANHKSSVKFKLSHEGAINPGETIMIVPETEKDNLPISALTVPRFRCFGVDAGENITTKLSTDKKDLAKMEEHFELIGDSVNSEGFVSVTEVVHAKEIL